MTILGNNIAAVNQPNLYPITALIGTSVNYGQQVSATFALGQQMIGMIFNRSNATVSMSDTLPQPNNILGDLGNLPNGWNIIINNIDASAAITLTPVTATINGSSSLTINAGTSATVVTDGINYFATTGTVISNTTLRPEAANTGAVVALNTLASGSVMLRSHSGSAMSDTLAVASTLANGWWLTVINADTIASDTITPTTSTINGAATLVIPAGQSATIVGNGTNYFATLSPAYIRSVQPLTASTGSPKVLSSFSSGSIIQRSNSTTAMADTLANANTLPNGWWIEVFNIDASATDTITPAVSTINGGATLAITAGQSSIIRTDGVNYFATTPA